MSTSENKENDIESSEKSDENGTNLNENEPVLDEESVTVHVLNEESATVPVVNEESAAVPVVNEESAAVPVVNEESAAVQKNNGEGGSDQEHKLTQLPMTRIRGLMKLDPDFTVASAEAVLALTRATELFIESLAREAYTYTAQSKKKTVQKQDVELAIAAVDSLMFLDGALNV